MLSHTLFFVFLCVNFACNESETDLLMSQSREAMGVKNVANKEDKKEE